MSKQLLKELYERTRRKKIPTGLEALDNLRDYGEWLPAYEMGIIRNELKRLEKIDNILPVEIRDTDDLERLINYSVDVQNKIKVLEILKDKCEFIFIKEEIVGQPTRYEIRIMPINEVHSRFTCLAISAKDQEEYDLLKETLL